jgi:hypothetical protein
VEYPPGWPISLAGAVVIRTICDLPIICDRVTLAVAWLVAELSAVPLAAKGTKSVQTNAGRCHVGGPNRVGHLASGQLAALVQQFDRKLVKLRSASARGRRGHLALLRTMTEKGGA